MDKNEKHIWMDEPSEPQDQASRQVIRALYELYRVDEDDKHSVERAWQRIAREAHMQLPESRKNTEFFEYHHPQPQRSSYSLTWRQPMGVMVAVLVCLLLVGSMVGVFSLMQRSGQQGQQPNNPTVVPTPSPGKPLGKRLGRVTLGMSTDEIWALLGEVKPLPGPESPNIYTLLFYSEVDIHITLKPSDSGQQWGKAVRLIAYGRFQGETAEGFGLGMTLDEFTQIYASYESSGIERIDVENIKFTFPFYVKQPGFATSVTDGDGTTLYVIFDRQQKAAQIVLQSGNDLKFKQDTG